MKSRKRILIVGRTFYPQRSPRAFRTTELANEIARQGHSVTVVLPQNIQREVNESFENQHSINFEYYGPLKWKTLGKSKVIGDVKRKFGRLLFLLLEYPNIEIHYRLPRFLKKFKDFDLMISIAVPHENHWAIAKIRSEERPIAKVWVADCGDPFVNNVLETIPPPFYFHYFENSFLKKANYISVPTEDSIDAYNPQYRKKFVVIPQGFNFEEIQLGAYNKKNDIIEFAYAGGVSRNGVRSLHKVIDLLKRIESDFKFHIYSSNASNILYGTVKEWDDKIILHEAIDRKELLYKLSQMDFLLNLDNNTHLNTPSKLIDYALCKRPILNIDPINPSEELLTQFLNGCFKHRYVVNNLDQYNIKNVVNRFMELVK